MDVCKDEAAVDGVQGAVSKADEWCGSHCGAYVSVANERGSADKRAQVKVAAIANGRMGCKASCMGSGVAWVTTGPCDKELRRTGRRGLSIPMAW